jgi:hypothetical protein
MTLLLQLFLAHLLGDFLLQPNAWVMAKENRKIKAWQLYIHALIHGVLVLLLVGSLAFWPWALLLSGLHLFIDGLKISFQNEGKKRVFFFLDQVAHLLSIVLVWASYEHFNFSVFIFHRDYLLLMATALFLLTIPTSVAIKIFISKWTPKTESRQDESLQSAGKYIGYLERLLAFIFIMANHWEAVGFLLAAKSIFRFGDLKESKDRKLTEYVLIGTLLSFGVAIVVAIGLKHLGV